MSKSSLNAEGGKENVLSYSDESLNGIENLNLDIDINVSCYSDEIYISNYITNIFKSLNSVFENSKRLIEGARNYIQNNISISENTKQPELINFDFSIDGEIAIPEQSAFVNLNDKGSHLNLRSGAGMSSKVISLLDNNTKLTILDKGTEDSSWVKVKTEDGTIGFVSSSYITSTLTTSPLSGISSYSTISPTSGTSTKGIVNTNNSGLNLRRSPEKSNNIITSIPMGTEVEILESNPNKSWTKVKVGDKIGYVFSKYLKVEDEKKN